MKKIKLSRFKNFVIVLLVITAVYQTGLLWLGSNASHNFFYSLFENRDLITANNNAEKTAVDPKKTVVSFGNNTFNVMYETIEESSLSIAIDEFLVDVLTNAKTITVEEIDYTNYLSGKAVINEYSFNLSPVEYTSGLGVDIDLDIESINNIILKPSGISENENKIYFIDNNNSKAVAVSGGTIDRGRLFLEEIENYEDSHVVDLRYISTTQSGLNIFKNNTFVPQWTQSNYEYNLLLASNIMDKNEEEVFNFITKDLSSFFGNYSGNAITKDSSGIYISSVENIIIRYHPNGYMEYFNYETRNENIEQTLSTAYFACKEFLKNLGETELYLEEVKIGSEGLIFYYNYTENNLPIFLSDEIKEEINSDYAVEVIVEENVVTGYKKLLYEFELSKNENNYVNVDFVSAINNAVSKMEKDVIIIEDMQLGYYLQNNDLMTELKWLVNIDGESIIINGALDGQ